METRTIFAQRLSQTRKLHGETQSQLAQAMGTSISAINNYENARRIPDIDFLRAVSAHYQVSADYILGVSDDQSIQDTQMEACEKIAQYFGWEPQVKQTLQEMAELQVELTARPDQKDKNWSGNVREEIADCMIMLTQLALMLDGCMDKVSAEMGWKLQRTQKKIAEDAIA